MSTSTNPAPDSGSMNNPVTPNLSVVPPEETSPQTRSLLNKAQLRELDMAEDVVIAAQKTDRVEPLTKSKIPPAFVVQLEDDVKAARKVNTSIVESTVGGQQATEQGADCGQKLVGSLRQIQTAARQEYVHSQPLKLKEYLVGEIIDANRSMLEQSSQTLIDKADAERPGAVDTAFVQKATTERSEYVGCDAAQAGELSEAQQARARLAGMVETIKERRQKIQLAAEFLWPSTQPANAGIRREFQLPASRPYVI